MKIFITIMIAIAMFFSLMVRVKHYEDKPINPLLVVVAYLPFITCVIALTIIGINY